ncbi:MAG: MFS transporter [Pseudomonadota bacterium]
MNCLKGAARYAAAQHKPEELPMAFVVPDALRGERQIDVLRRGTIVGLIAFLTLIDLFGAQALLPRLTEAYGVDAATMGFAVNASTIGMAISGLAVAWFSDRIDRKRGLWVSLACLSVPTARLGVTDNVTVFLLLRIAQGVFMAAAFTLTMTYLSEQCDITAAAGAMAAYITGNVASNLFGRLMAASLADWVGVSGSFFAFAVLNLAGAALAYSLIGPRLARTGTPGSRPLEAWRAHLAVPALRSAFAIGFLLLSVFVGVFTYVNFELAGPLGLAPGMLGLVYFVFLLAIFTTPVAGRVARRYGAQRVFWGASAVTVAGLALMALPSLPAVLVGMAIVGAGTFFAQAAATGFVGRRAKRDHAAANGLYLTAYYLGGLTGALLLGQLYALAGWPPTLAVLALALGVAAWLARALDEPLSPPSETP